jgi:hypothetical protein
MEIEKKQMLLTIFGSTDEKYILIDGELEASVRVNGQGLFRFGDDENGLYLNFKYHAGPRVWGAEVVPSTNYCDVYVNAHIESGSLIIEVECDDTTPIYVWDVEQQVWCRVECDKSDFAKEGF